METIIVHPSSTAEWQALVLEAENQSSITLTEDLESYLVFLLMRFSNAPEIIQSIFAEEFLESFQLLKNWRLQNLKNLGDKCLLFAGLFPGNARKRRVRISYFVNLGQTAYCSIAEEQSSKSSELYGNLSEQFVLLMDVLHTMRELRTLSPYTLSSPYAALDLLQAEELWTDTKSQHALKVLRAATKGFLISPDSNSQKH